MLAEMTLLDLVGLLVSFVLTVMVLLYAFDDNPIFRLAVYIFVGVAAGYASAVALKDVILPRLFGLEGMQLILVIVCSCGDECPPSAPARLQTPVSRIR